MKIFDGFGRRVEVEETQTALPIGTVLMFNGANITLPGWYKCDGNNGTPNLVDKFIRSEAASGNTGGLDTNTHRHDFRIALFDYGWKPAGASAAMKNAGAYKYSTSSYGDSPGYDDQETSNVGVSASTASISHNRVPSVGDTDVGSENENKPAYSSLIYVMRVT